MSSQTRVSALSTDPLGLLLGTVQSAVALGLFFVLPGMGIGAIAAPGAMGPASRLGRAVGASLLTAATVCTVLAEIGMLHPAVVIPLLAAIWLVPLAWRGRGVAIDSMRGRARSIRRLRRWLPGAIIGAAFAAVVVVVPSRLDVGSTLLPFTSTVWYYANLAESTAALGRFPATLAEWGSQRPFQTDYLPVTAHTAGALQLLPGDFLVEMEVYRVAILIAALIVAVMLLRRWFSSWLALIGACLLLTTVRLAFKFVSYKPETFALVLAFYGWWLVDRAIVERSRRLAVSAVATGVILFLSHAEVFLVFAAGIAGIAGARWLVSSRKGWVGLRLPTPNRTALSLGLAVAVIGGSAVGGTLGNVVLTGEARLVGYVVGSDGSTATVSPPGPIAVPDGWVTTGDRTWDFYVAAVAWGQLGSPPPQRFTDRRLLQRSILQVWPGLDGRIRSLLPVLLGLLAIPLLAWPWLDPRRRRAVAAWYGMGAVLAAGSFALFKLAHTYVPERVGPRRLMPDEVIVPAIALLIGLWVLAEVLRPGWQRLLPGRAGSVAGLVLVSVLAFAATLPAKQEGQTGDDVDPGLTTIGLDAYRWIAANTPADARILTNAYTDGSVAALSGRVGIVDGRAVYLEQPAFLAESTNLLLGARATFARPGEPEAAAFLVGEGVDYVLVATSTTDGSDLGGYRPFATDLAAMAASARYTLVQSFGAGRLLLYRVTASP